MRQPQDPDSIERRCLTVITLSYLPNGILYIGKMTSLYWNALSECAQILMIGQSLSTQVQAYIDGLVQDCSNSIANAQGAVSIRKTVLPGMAIPMLKIRRPNGRLIFNMEIAIRR